MADTSVSHGYIASSAGPHRIDLSDARRTRASKTPEAKRAYRRTWYLKNKDRVHAYNKMWRVANPEKQRGYIEKSKETNRERERFKQRLKMRRRQNLPEPTRSEPPDCECCGKPRGKRCLLLDHDHITSAFRGWVCNRCNAGIGMLGDDKDGLLKALSYLERSNERSPMPVCV